MSQLLCTFVGFWQLRVLHLLLERDLDEFRRAGNRDQHPDPKNSFQDIVGTHGFTQPAQDVESIFRGGAGQAAAFPDPAEEIADHARDVAQVVDTLFSKTYALMASMIDCSTMIMVRRTLT